MPGNVPPPCVNPRSEGSFAGGGNGAGEDLVEVMMRVDEAGQ